MEAKRWKLLLFGSPAFALPSFRALADDPRYEITGVVTQPDKPAGRGQKLTPPPVKVFAQERGFPVFQPRTLKDLERDPSAPERIVSTRGENPFAHFLAQAAPFDAFVVIAYGKIIVESLLNYPKKGILNVHASLLPRWRGACPVQWAIFAGDPSTGVCLMEIEKGLDTGAVYARAERPLDGSETFGSLYDDLSTIGAKLLVENLPDILSGKVEKSPQPEVGVTHAEKWTREHARIRWADPAEVTARRIRASAPEPGSIAIFRGPSGEEERVKIFHASLRQDPNAAREAPGTIVEVNRAELLVATGSADLLSLEVIQFPGKKRLPIREVMLGRRFSVGERFENG